MDTSQPNPYASPNEASVQLASDEPSTKINIDLELGQFTKFVVGMTVGGALFGACLGLALGLLAPDYYRAVFSSGDHPDFNPIAIGLGLGLTQGAGAGLVAGLVLVATYCWYKVRLLNNQTS